MSEASAGGSKVTQSGADKSQRVIYLWDKEFKLVKRLIIFVMY